MSDGKIISVLQVVDSLGMGGAETWLMELLRLWSKRQDVQVDFLATSGIPQIFDDEARQLGARIHYLSYRRAHLRRFAEEFREVLRNRRYDAIHDHQDYASGWHFLMGAGVLPPVRVTHVHNPSYQIRSNYGVTLTRRLTSLGGKELVARFATHLTGTSRQLMTEYGFDAARFDRIPKAALYCGFDPIRFAGDTAAAKHSLCREFNWPNSSKIILFAGRIDSSPNPGDPHNHKNSGFALSVGIQSALREEHVRMLVAGASGPAVPVLERRIASANLEGRIRFTGVRKDIQRLMLGSDVLLFPSRAEGLGMVAVEAQASGLPVLASTTVPRECVVMPDLVRFKNVESGAEQWALALLEMMTLPRDVPSAQRRLAASAFSIENSAGALFRLYKEGYLRSEAMPQTAALRTLC